MAKLAERAVVVGSGMGGLLATRVLADHFDEVLVVERDELPSGAQARRGVPQGRHVHALLARGRDVLEQHFPGFSDEVVARGGVTGDMGGDTRIFLSGGCLTSFHSGLDLLFASRPLLEAVTRERVGALPNVRLLDRTDAVGLTAEKGQVSGVRLQGPGDEAEHRLAADLVVSATGRAASPLAWLAELGFASPDEEEVGVDLTYVTRTYRRRPGDLGGARLFTVVPEPPSVLSVAALVREDDLWTVTLIGYLGEQPPTDLVGFRRYTAAVPAPELCELLTSAEPVGDAAVTRFPASRRRRFEQLDAFPEGYLVFGDVISVFNPVYGQGMTVAAEESLALADALALGLTGLSRRFFTAAGRIIDTAWALSACGDLRWPQVVGQRTAQIRFLNAYVARLTRAAHHDPIVAQAFFRTTNLLDPPSSLLRPTIAARVLVGGSPTLARLPRQRNSQQRAASG